MGDRDEEYEVALASCVAFHRGCSSVARFHGFGFPLLFFSLLIHVCECCIDICA